ncbi:MAG: ABC transporter ATP-binding protein [Archaeoglobaceae archaeon]|nr:ABC transporter ATP-binding protein [Archaeoglobaceae archaeon]
MIVCEKVSKKFGEKFAIRDLSFTADGKIAVLGFNGAGKSTLAKIIAGILKPTSGKVKIFGLDPVKSPELRKKIGIVTHNPMLYRELTVRENLEFYAKVYQSGNWIEVVNRLKLEDVLNLRVSELSRGFVQRVAIARALIPRPRILIMDEVLSGLDLESRNATLNLMQEFNGILVFSTHNLHDVEFCDSFLVLENGEMVYFGNSYEKAIRSLSAV